MDMNTESLIKYKFIVDLVVINRITKNEILELRSCKVEKVLPTCINPLLLLLCTSSLNHDGGLTICLDMELSTEITR